MLQKFLYSHQRVLNHFLGFVDINLFLMTQSTFSLDFLKEYSSNSFYFSILYILCKVHLIASFGRHLFEGEISIYGTPLISLHPSFENLRANSTYCSSSANQWDPQCTLFLSHHRKRRNDLYKQRGIGPFGFTAKLFGIGQTPSFSPKYFQRTF